MPDIFKELQTALLTFVDYVGINSIRNKPGTIPELLGKLQLDMIDTHKNYEKTLERIKQVKT